MALIDIPQANLRWCDECEAGFDRLDLPLDHEAGDPVLCLDCQPRACDDGDACTDDDCDDGDNCMTIKLDELTRGAQLWVYWPGARALEGHPAGRRVARFRNLTSSGAVRVELANVTPKGELAGGWGSPRTVTAPEVLALAADIDVPEVHPFEHMGCERRDLPGLEAP